MMIIFDKLWITMELRGTNQYQINKDFGIANSQFQRMHKNKPVTTTTIDRLCEILDCRIEDIIEYHPRSK